MLGNLLNARATAEAGDIPILARVPFAAPRVVRSGDARDLFVSQLAVRAVNQHAQLARVIEERVAAAVAELAVLLVPRQKPEARRNLRVVEKLRRQRDHAVHQIGLDDEPAYLPFPARVRRHRAVGEDDARHAARREVVNDVLQLGEVRVTRRRHAVSPAHVVAQAFPAPGALKIKAPGGSLVK